MINNLIIEQAQILKAIIKCFHKFDHHPFQIYKFKLYKFKPCSILVDTCLYRIFLSSTCIELFDNKLKPFFIHSFYKKYFLIIFQFLRKSNSNKIQII